MIWIGDNWEWALPALMCLSISLLCVYMLYRLKREIAFMVVTGLPREGFPDHIEASWEDVGAHGRFLTDLGGMSIKMREQMYEEFRKALSKPILGTPAAGSINDIIADMDQWLMHQERDRCAAVRVRKAVTIKR